MDIVHKGHVNIWQTHGFPMSPAFYQSQERALKMLPTLCETEYSKTIQDLVVKY